MKKFIVLICFLLSICFTSFSQLFMSKEKKALIHEIDHYIARTVSTASYNKKAPEVYNAMYVVATKEFNDIVKESEKRGYIEAKKETDLKKTYITIELRGDEPPYRVSFQIKIQSRNKDYTTGAYSDWKEGSASESYITKLQKEVYEILNGPITFPKDLQDKIDNFNSKETKDRKKILKGIDY